MQKQPDQHTTTFFSIYLNKSLSYLAKEISDGITALREAYIKEWGIALPPIRIANDCNLEENEYSLYQHNTEKAKFTVVPDKQLVIDNTGSRRLNISPERIITEPAYSLPSAWIDDNEAKKFSELPVINTCTLILTHFHTIAKVHLAEFITEESTAHLLELQRTQTPELLSKIEALPSFSISNCQKLLQELASHNLPVYEMKTILKTVIDHNGNFDCSDSISEILSSKA